MIDTDALKTEVEALLTGMIGTYTFSGGQQTIALRIEDGSDPYTEQPSVDGLEVVIRPETEMDVAPLLAGDRRFDYRSEIVLKQWEITATTRQAREVLTAKLAGLEEVGAIVPRSNVLDNIETCTLIVGDGFYTYG